MAKKIVLTIDVETGQFDSVTDENGNPAQASNTMPEKMKDATTTDIANVTLVGTHSSPGCRWVFHNGVWYWICT